MSGIEHLLELYTAFCFFCRIAASFNNRVNADPQTCRLLVAIQIFPSWNVECQLAGGQVTRDVRQGIIICMKPTRNKQIAISVLKGMTYENVGILYNISRERVYQITRRTLIRIDPELAEKYSIRAFRLDSDRLINLMNEHGKNGQSGI